MTGCTQAQHRFREADPTCVLLIVCCMSSGPQAAAREARDRLNSKGCQTSNETVLRVAAQYTGRTGSEQVRLQVDTSNVSLR